MKGSWRVSKQDLCFASAASALACEGKGATQGLKSFGQVISFLKKHS